MIERKYKAVISDVDGTFTPSQIGALPTEKVKRKVQEAVDAGLVFILATGRPYSRLKYLLDHLGHVGLCIVDNGAVIIDSKDGTVIYEAILPHEHATRILELARGIKLVRVSYDTGVVENPTQVVTLSKVRKVSVHNIILEQAEKLIKQVESEFDDVTCVKAASYEGDHLIDVYFSDINATKEQAVLQIAQILDVDVKAIIGVGDGHNDISLLKACGYGVAMGNAVDELKAIADYIAPSVEDDGLADVLEKYFLTISR